MADDGTDIAAALINRPSRSAIMAVTDRSNLDAAVSLTFA